MEKAVTLKILDVVKETDDAISIHFKQPFLGKLKYSAGQFLTLLVSINGEILRRCYSLNSAPGVDEDVSVTVKRIKDGKVSNYLYDNIKKGDKLKVLRPMGSFTMTPNKKDKRHFVLFGAGSGITPLISILKTVLNKEPESLVSLIYGNRDKESIIFNEELKSYKETFNGRLTLLHILENPGDFEDCYKGRVERSQVTELLQELPSLEESKTEYFICGPSGMMTEAEEGLKIAGVSPSQINIEKFSAPPIPSSAEIKAAGPLITNREINIVFKGKSHAVPVKAGTTILDAALDEKIKIPYVCMDGICGTCKARKCSGEVHMRSGHVLSKKELDENIILTCISKPLTDNLTLEIE